MTDSRIVLPGSPEFNQTFEAAINARGDPGAVPPPQPTILPRRDGLLGAILNNNNNPTTGDGSDQIPPREAPTSTTTSPVTPKPYTLSVVEIGSSYGNPQTTSWIKDSLAAISPDLILYSGNLTTGKFDPNKLLENSLQAQLVKANKELLDSAADDSQIEARLTQILEGSIKNMQPALKELSDVAGAPIYLLPGAMDPSTDLLRSILGTDVTFIDQTPGTYQLSDAGIDYSIIGNDISAPGAYDGTLSDKVLDVWNAKFARSAGVVNSPDYTAADTIYATNETEMPIVASFMFGPTISPTEEEGKIRFNQGSLTYLIAAVHELGTAALDLEIIKKQIEATGIEVTIEERDGEYIPVIAVSQEQLRKTSAGVETMLHHTYNENGLQSTEVYFSPEGIHRNMINGYRNVVNQIN